MDFTESDVTVLDHTADLGIKVRGDGIKALFERTAVAMMQLMVSSTFGKNSKNIRLSLESDDPAELMVHWLGEILYLFYGEKRIVIRPQIDSISSTHLDATLETTSFDPELHEVIYEIKAATFHQIEVVEKNDHWVASVIFDL